MAPKALQKAIRRAKCHILKNANALIESQILFSSHFKELFFFNFTEDSDLLQFCLKLIFFASEINFTVISRYVGKKLHE
jgi:hypothetical protein